MRHADARRRVAVAALLALAGCHATRESDAVRAGGEQVGIDFGFRNDLDVGFDPDEASEPVAPPGPGDASRSFVGSRDRVGRAMIRALAPDSARDGRELDLILKGRPPVRTVRWRPPKGPSTLVQVRPDSPGRCLVIVRRGRADREADSRAILDQVAALLELPDPAPAKPGEASTAGRADPGGKPSRDGSGVPR